MSRFIGPGCNILKISKWKDFAVENISIKGDLMPAKQKKPGMFLILIQII